ncbi:DeoR/GlpR family DNA-binding transcription regulator [Salsuginibacillus kocurii]|uniref:DeoR/GlpR family DNA-binding transcription regulator n=1 Tax=Salsuginibacillus kocurii TaxID=427078 RepID=UPI00037D7FFD|nr:DeoR/GlpR family DNA-binding transcription regulator [Salsuginibacillus kocurii]
MNQEERLVHILTFLEEEKSLNIKELCDRFHVSRDTARRDIVKLSERGLVTRTYGGITVPSFFKVVDHYTTRTDEEVKAKEAIGKRAVDFIQADDLVYFDVSTTVSSIPHYLNSQELSVVTNSIDAAQQLIRTEKVNIHLLGGDLNKESRHLSGSLAMQNLSHFYFNSAFVGALGVSEEGIFYGYAEDIYLKQEIRKRTNRMIVLADEKKLNQQAHYRGLEIEEVDVLITNGNMPAALQKRFQSAGVEVIEVK